MQSTPTKLVRQTYTTECGAACVAMLAGVGIRKARSLLGMNSTQRARRTSPEDIRRALAEADLVLGRETWTSNWHNVAKQTQPVLVALNYRPKDLTNGRDCYVWHWAVYDPRRKTRPLLDPQSKSSPRDPGRSVLSSYFKVLQHGDA